MSMNSSITTSCLPDLEHFHRGLWGTLFGEEICLMRQERGLSIEQAAERAGMSSEEWQAVERGRAPESWEQICAVGEGLGEERVVMASLVIRYAGAWEDGHGLPGQIRKIYS